MKFPFLTKPPAPETSAAAAAAASWPWSSCTNSPRTFSFRAAAGSADKIFGTTNREAEFYPYDDYYRPEGSKLQSEIIGPRSGRFFFEPGETSSIVKEAKLGQKKLRSEGPSMVAIESRDPFLDFRASMAEMVRAHDLSSDWESLEELLALFLKLNSKNNHGYIIGAFVDIVTNLTAGSNDSSSSSKFDEIRCSSSSTVTQCSFTSPLSFSSSGFCCLENDENGVV
ncbi:hypothetical protein M569_13386 [Genlisea aurea]|uniref:Transcription repressor n=1 Tax=Genlisea aurea TaxID=192259 RepID=S8CAM8_9LAMI|nr:hypothetical protein M569_13386 [Genlisea aurea]